MTTPITIPAETARELAYKGVDGTADGYTVVAVEDLGNRRWESLHRLVIRDEHGQHYADTYTVGLTQDQGWGPWEHDYEARFEPVFPQARVTVKYVADPAAGDLSEGPFDVLIADGEVQLLDDCPTCRTGSVVGLPAGQALLGAAQLALAATLAQAGVPDEPEAPVLVLVGSSNAGAR